MKSVNFNGLSIDTRTLKKDNLFLGLKGKKYDGNRMIYKALKRCRLCCFHFKFQKKNKKIIKIDNSISFLSRFARFKRENTSAKIIAITGSAGKTSLKNLIKNLLNNFGKTHSSPKSFNNHLGVPISLSNLNFEDKFGVFEVGMSRAVKLRVLQN